LDAAEGRATQLATRLAEVEAEAAEAVPRTEELGRWQALMQRMQPGGSGPEALQRVVEALQRDVAARADACTKAQARAAELQGACSFVGVLCFLNQSSCINYRKNDIVNCLNSTHIIAIKLVLPAVAII
jgi:hypothetical protein